MIGSYKDGRNLRFPSQKEEIRETISPEVDTTSKTGQIISYKSVYG